MKMGGGVKLFGIDVECVFVLVCQIIVEGVEWCGFYIFVGSQVFDVEVIVDIQVQMLVLVVCFVEVSGVVLLYCNFGGGMGIFYFLGDMLVDVVWVGELLGEQFEWLFFVLVCIEFCIELGCYLVGQVGVYVICIVDCKISYGEVFFVIDGGLYYQFVVLGNFGMVVWCNYLVVIVIWIDQLVEEEVLVVGCFCILFDCFVDKVGFLWVEVGDFVVVFCVGVYGVSVSLVVFLGQGLVVEMLV